MNKNIIWIASYPKSGNTWMRSILASLFYSDKGSFDFNLIKNITNFDNIKNYKKAIGDTAEKIGSLKSISRYRLTAQEFFNKKNKVTFFKTHSANIKIDNHPYTSPETTKGVIYMVRDPRDIILSYSSFSKKSLSETIGILKNEKYSVANPNSGFTTLWSRWDYHISSWYSLDVPKIFIRYEDLLDFPIQTTVQIIFFLRDKLGIKCDFTDDKILNTIKNTSFAALKEREKKQGFEESIYGTNFFNTGKKNLWKENFSPSQSKEIEEIFFETMVKFNYLNK